MDKEEIRQFKSILRLGILRKMNVSLDYKFQEALLKIIKDYEQLETNRDELKKWLEEEKDRLVRECSNIYEDSLGKTKLVSEDIFNELTKVSEKIDELKRGKE